MKTAISCQPSCRICSALFPSASAHCLVSRQHVLSSGLASTPWKCPLHEGHLHLFWGSISVWIQSSMKCCCRCSGREWSTLQLVFAARQPRCLRFVLLLHPSASYRTLMMHSDFPPFLFSALDTERQREPGFQPHCPCFGYFSQ